MGIHIKILNTVLNMIPFWLLVQYIPFWNGHTHQGFEYCTEHGTVLTIGTYVPVLAFYRVSWTSSSRRHCYVCLLAYLDNPSSNDSFYHTRSMPSYPCNTDPCASFHIWVMAGTRYCFYYFHLCASSQKYYHKKNLGKYCHKNSIKTKFRASKCYHKKFPH